MRNIWNNDEPEPLPFTATCTASGECVDRGKVDPYSGVVPVELALCFLRGRRGGHAVILMMLWYLNDFSFVLSGHNSIAVVARAAVSNFINTNRGKVRGAVC